MLKKLNKKEEFLSKLKTKNGYKRYLGSPLRYPGGKSLAVGKITEVAWQYTMSQGETRISKTRIREGRNNVKQSHEIIITNY